MRRLVLALALLTPVMFGCDDERPRSAPTEIQGPLDLNRATTKQLEQLPGIGDHLARSIIASRNARGGHFNSVDDLLKIDGIGDKTLEKIRPLVYVGP
ncbi:MAG TPA: helix-hairpin-helix domain-containing protein [Kofleriaceae bacterium]|nr:helix-hairpin-helix domain-containing protein [Kofleriaceae bacterium]